MPSPTLTLNIGFAQNTGTYLVLDNTVSGLLDTNQLAAGRGLVPVWTDTSSYIEQLQCRRGRQRQVDQFAAGGLSATLTNGDGRFSPSNLSGPYVSGGATEVIPGIAINFLATWNGTQYSLWYGYINQWNHVVDIQAVKAIKAGVTAVDGFQQLSRNQMQAVTPVGGGELSGPRINRLLDAAGWDTGLRDIDDGQTTLQPSDLSGVALQSLQAVADSEGGSLYMSEAGKVTFRQRYARITNTRSNTSQATFSDAAGATSYCTIIPRHDDTLIINRAQYSRAGGTVQTVDDAASQANNGVITRTQSNLLNQTDLDVQSVAGWVVGRFRNPEFRIDSFSIKPEADPNNLWPLALGLKIDDRVTLVHHPAAGDTITMDVFIESIAHSYSPSTPWVTTFECSSAAAWLPFFILDSSTQGVLNTNALAY